MLMLVLVTQYSDTTKEIGTNDKGNTIFDFSFGQHGRRSLPADAGAVIGDQNGESWAVEPFAASKASNISVTGTGTRLGFDFPGGST